MTSSPLVMPPSRPPARFDGARELLGARVVSDFVHHFGAVGSGRGDSRADLHALHRLDGHHGLRQPRVEFFVPLRVRAEAGDHIVRHNFENASHGVSGAVHDVHFAFHLRFGLGDRRSAAANPDSRRRLESRSRLRRATRRALPTAITWLSTSHSNWRSSNLAIVPPPRARRFPAPTRAPGYSAHRGD